MLRAIREIRPSWIVGENVPGIINWSRGLVFNEVQTNLENEGYKVLPTLLPACSVNAPHKRERIWFVAYSDSYGHELCRPGKDRQEKGEIKGKENKREWVWGDTGRTCEQGAFSDTNGIRQKGGMYEDGEKRKISELYASASNARNSRRTAWQDFPTQPPICGRDDGISSRLDGITFPKWRNESIKAYGNAIVPQVVFQIFKAIEEYQNNFS